jgi:ribose 5-phosphate isomerase A
VSSASEQEKRAVAAAAAALVEDGMMLGLGTGSTIAHLLPALAERGLRSLRCVSTSPRTEEAARALGIPVEDFDTVTRLDMAIDGADQVDPDGWLIKGGGAAHTREKIVARTADRFVVVVSSDKVVEALVAPVPLELLAFGLASTLEAVSPATLREGTPPTPDGGIIADHHGPLGDPAGLAARLAAIPGVVEHGLFPPDMVSEVLIARGEAVERRDVS